jgi:hypothetical protein
MASVSQNTRRSSGWRAGAGGKCRYQNGNRYLLSEEGSENNHVRGERNKGGVRATLRLVTVTLTLGQAKSVLLDRAFRHDQPAHKSLCKGTVNRVELAGWIEAELEQRFLFNGVTKRST